MNIIYFIPALAILAFFTWKNISYGLYIILATVPAFLLRTKITFVPTTWLELAIYTVFLTWLIKEIINKTLKSHLYYCLHKAKPYILPISLLIIATLMSIIFSQNQARAFGIFKAWFIDPLFLSLVFVNTIKSTEDLKKTYLFFSFSAWPIIVYGLIDYLLNINLTISGRLDSFFSSPNYVGMYLVPLGILILAHYINFFKTSSHQVANLIKKPLILYLTIWLFFTTLTIILTKSFGSWFAALGAYALIIILHTKISFKKICLLILSLSLLSSLIFYLHQTSYSHYDEFWQTNSLQTRQEIWLNSIKILIKSPLLGIGLADFKDAYQRYVDELPIEKKPIETEILRPHNLYLDFWIETGILGLIAFLWIIYIFYQTAIKKYSMDNNELIIPAMAAMLAIILHGFVDTPYFKNDLSLLFWLLITINIAQYKSYKKSHINTKIPFTSSGKGILRYLENNL